MTYYYEKNNQWIDANDHYSPISDPELIKRLKKAKKNKKKCKDFIIVDKTYYPGIGNSVYFELGCFKLLENYSDKITITLYTESKYSRGISRFDVKYIENPDVLKYLVEDPTFSVDFLEHWCDIIDSEKIIKEIYEVLSIEAKLYYNLFGTKYNFS